MSSISKKAAIGMAAGTFMFGAVSGCAVGWSIGSSDSGRPRHPTSSSASSSNDIPRISPIPITPTADELFAVMVEGLPITIADAKMLAVATCLAFKQNPGTSMSSAARQLANQLDRQAGPEVP